MNDIDKCNEALGELVNNVLSQTCEAFEKFCDNLREFADYLSETFFSSELWLYTQSWFEACIKNPKSLHYMRRCKKHRIRKKHANRLAREAFKIYEERRKQNDKHVCTCRP